MSSLEKEIKKIASLDYSKIPEEKWNKILSEFIDLNDAISRELKVASFRISLLEKAINDQR